MPRLGSGTWFCSLLILVVAAWEVRSQEEFSVDWKSASKVKTVSATDLRTASPPADLPRYDLHIHLDVAQRMVRARQVVTWTNRTGLPTREIVFNAHSHYSIPDKDIGFLAKTLELLRMSPKEAMNFDGPPLEVQSVRYRGISPFTAAPSNTRPSPGEPVDFHYSAHNATALIVPLPEMLKQGESVTLELDFTLKIPPKKGRWGQWEGITTLAQWLPVVAVYDPVKSWQPTPFVPWHQPFFNEAGHYTVRVRLPSDQKLAASASVSSERELPDGWKEVVLAPICVRDFALIASAEFQEWTGETNGVKIRCLARPKHAFYAKDFVETVAKAIPVYDRWFGKYPYPQFTVVESCFGWNGNECGALVMIDDRMFNFPELARNYPNYLLQHELCHQWWYNVVGTNGYSETWMDEALATYFSHRLADQIMGPNTKFLDYPKQLSWLPNIRRDDFRNYSMIGSWARGEGKPCVSDMPDFGHLVNLTSAAYDRGSKVVGMIEDRLGEQAFLDFMRQIYSKYQFRIISVADYRRELEAYTGRSWEEFFQHWLYGIGQCDWAIERVEIDSHKPSVFSLKKPSARGEPVRVVVHLYQKGEFNEPTTIGFRLVAGTDYQVRIPIQPDVAVLNLEEFQARVECVTEMKKNKPCATVKIEIVLPSEPLQITVDPDHILADTKPTNNNWKQEVRWNLTPFATQLDEVDVTNAYDRWNITVAPWFYFAAYNNPWYARSDLAGLRAGVFRTQEVNAGAYVAYRTVDGNLVAGADIVWDHVPLPNTQIGFNVEQVIAQLGNASIADTRGVLYARYIMMYGSSLYLPPFEYIETFAMVQDNGLPVQQTTPNIDPYRERPSLGIHYHKNLQTPYWDAEGGFTFDITYEYGLPILGNGNSFQEVFGQFSFVKGMPKFEMLGDGPVMRWLNDTRFAFRLGGAAGLPANGLLFPLGGNTGFRGFDLSERQGNLMWVGSIEWRLPIATNLPVDLCDHIMGVRNIYLAPFYDVGDAYVNSQEVGSIAHAFGIGLRVDVSWLGLIERTMLRLDVAKTINADAPWQFWFGVQHPF